MRAERRCDRRRHTNFQTTRTFDTSAHLSSALLVSSLISSTSARGRFPILTVAHISSPSTWTLPIFLVRDGNSSIIASTNFKTLLVFSAPPLANRFHDVVAKSLTSSFVFIANLFVDDDGVDVPDLFLGFAFEEEEDGGGGRGNAERAFDAKRIPSNVLRAAAFASVVFVFFFGGDISRRSRLGFVPNKTIGTTTTLFVEEEKIRAESLLANSRRFVFGTGVATTIFAHSRGKRRRVCGARCAQ